MILWEVGDIPGTNMEKMPLVNSGPGSRNFCLFCSTLAVLKKRWWVCLGMGCFPAQTRLVKYTGYHIILSKRWKGQLMTLTVLPLRLSTVVSRRALLCLSLCFCYSLVVSFPIQTVLSTITPVTVQYSKSFKRRPYFKTNYKTRGSKLLHTLVSFLNGAKET